MSIHDPRLGEIFGTACEDSRPVTSKRPPGETEHEVDVLVSSPHSRPALTVFDVGSNVFVGETWQISACVTGVAIYGQGRVQYQVSWWDNATHRSEWLEEFEVRATPNTPTAQIGFRNGGEKESKKPEKSKPYRYGEAVEERVLQEIESGCSPYIKPGTGPQGRAGQIEYPPVGTVKPSPPPPPPAMDAAGLDEIMATARIDEREACAILVEQVAAEIKRSGKDISNADFSRNLARWIRNRDDLDDLARTRAAINGTPMKEGG